MTCSNCCRDIEQERLEILPQTLVCSSCARQYNLGKPRKGVMISTGKVGSEIQILSHDCYKKQEKYLKAQGAYSIIKNFSRAICS